MTEAEVQKLRDSGISDAVILDLQKEEASKQGQAGPVVEAKSELPEIDPNTPSKVFSQAKTNQIPTEGSGQTWTQTAMEVAPALGSAAVAAAPYAAGAAGLYGGSRLLNAAKTAADAYKTGVQTAADTAKRNVALQEARMAERLARNAPRPMGPVNPNVTYNVPTQNVPQMRAPVPTQGAVAPQNLQNQVRQQAAKRIIGMGATAVPTAVGLGGAAATGFAGGQVASMTPEQRKEYYDNMMLGAMGGDTALAAAIMNRGQ